MDRKKEDQEYLKKVESKLVNKNVDAAYEKLKTCNYYILSYNLEL